MFAPYKDGLGFVPTIEAIDDGNAFITDHPLKIVAKGQAHGVPHLIGHTSGEGITSSIREILLRTAEFLNFVVEVPTIRLYFRCVCLCTTFKPIVFNRFSSR